MFPYELDLSWVVAFQALGDWLIVPMRFFSFLGTEEFYILMLPILYWCIDVGLGIRVGTIMLLSGSLNIIFKLPFTGPRPYWMSTNVKAFWAEISFGIPSGHAQQSVAIWGSVASYIRRKWAWGIAFILMLMIGLSRVYLGAHFFIDVFAGWIIGALVLWLYFRYWDPLVNWAVKKPLGMQILYAFLASAGIVMLGWIAILVPGDFILPEDWVINAARIGNEKIAPFSLSGLITLAGTLFGLLAGIAWLASRGGWQSAGPVGKRIARYLVGLLGVFVFWYGLGLFFPRGEALVPYVLRYVRYALLGFWVSAGAPFFFMKLKLS